ncbi:MAG: KR domain-containing protein, partial [Desulfobacteraceae bacterium]|nr:KR domain-containing protein [Desulfobacteraceae bacterium]
DTFSKVRSALVLDVLFRGQNPDFLAFCSSLSPATGQDNLGDWAENAFLDAFACYRNTTNAAGLRTLSVNRNRWSPEGEDLMTDKENPESFCRALFNGSSPQIIISPYDFRKADEFQVKNEEKRDAGQESEESLSAQPRPDLGNTYAAPGTETEKKLVSMWQEVLGIEQVGTNDNFFELGGDSLIATQVISRVRDAFQVEVSPENLFKNPTVAGIAEQVEILRWAMNEASEARADEELEEGEI